MVSIRFFGPGTLRNANGAQLSVRARKELAVLAYLLLERAQPHSRDSLQALFWQEFDTESARNNLRVVFSHLQALIPAEQPNHKFLITNRNEVEVNPASDLWVDAVEFQQQIEQTQRHDHTSRSACAECQPSLIKAVDLYRGEFLAGFALSDSPAFEEWLFLQRERQHLLMLQALHDLTVYAEANGKLESALGFALRQIELDPLRESAYRQKMQILAAQGDRSSALAAFERCETIINTELGVDVEPDTLALYQQIVDLQTRPKSAQLSVLHIPSSQAGSPPLSNIEYSLPRHNLAQQLTPFVGREQECEALQQRFKSGESRLITLVGAGGIGKSRLAQQVAIQHLHTFEHGVYFVPLTQIQSIDSIPSAIISAMGLTFNESKRTPKEQLLDKLRSQALLLVLDNFEHLMAGWELLLDILHQAPRIVLLITSRERLNLQAEDLFQLQGLPVPTHANDAASNRYAAIRLFADRAHRLDKRFRLSEEELPHVVRICQLLDGLPLGIELAATWMQEFGVAEIAANVAHSPGMLESAFHDLRPQHRSLRHVFDYSWSLLTRDEQAILARLAIFRGGFSTVTAQAVAGASRQTITHLRYKSLLVSTSAGLYDMHEIVRQFSLEKLDQLTTPTGESARAQTEEHHAYYYLDVLHQHEQPLYGATPRLTASQLQPLLDNIRQAWQWAVAHSAWEWLERCVVALSRFYEFSGLFAEAIANYFHADGQVARQLEAASKAEMVGVGTEIERLRRIRVRIMVELADHLHAQGRYQETEPILAQAIELSKLANDPYGQMRAKLMLANNRLVQGKNDEAFALFSAARALAQAGNFPLYEGLILRGLGNIWRQRGDFNAFEACLQQALTIQRSIGNLAEVYTLLTWLGGYRQLKRDIWGGRQLLEEALSLNDAVADPYREAILRTSLARNDAFLGRYDTARLQIRHLIKVHQQDEDRWHLISNKIIDVYIDYSTGDAQRALQTAQEVWQLMDKQTYGEHEAGLFTMLSYANVEANEVADAQHTFQHALERWLRINNQVRVIEAQAGLAWVALAQGNAEEALHRVEPILEYLENHELHAAVEPYRVYWAVYQILLAHGDARAQPLLQSAYANLQKQAKLVPEGETRRSFLENIPAHRRIYRSASLILGNRE